MPPVRRLSNTLGTAAFSWAVGQHVPDNQSGYRLLGRRLMAATLDSDETGFEFEVEMIAVCLRDGWTLGWVPISTIYAGEPSHVRPVAHLRHFVRATRAARRLMREGLTAPARRHATHPGSAPSSSVHPAPRRRVHAGWPSASGGARPPRPEHGPIVLVHPRATPRSPIPMTAPVAGAPAAPPRAAPASAPSPLAPVDLRALRDAIGGEVIVAGDATYDAARGIHNTHFDRQPGVIVRPRRRDRRVARRPGGPRARPRASRSSGGGHSVAGHSTTDGGLLHRPARDATRSTSTPIRRIGSAQGGATAGEYTTAAQHARLRDAVRRHAARWASAA